MHSEARHTQSALFAYQVEACEALGARKACLLSTKASLPMPPYSSGYSLSDLSMAELTVSVILSQGTLWGFLPSRNHSSKVDFQRGIFFPMWILNKENLISLTERQLVEY